MSENKTITIDGIEYDLVPKNKEQEKKKGRWKPECGQQYFSLDGEYRWVDDGYDNKCYALGFVFQIEQERDEYVARQQAIVRVNDRIDELNDWWVADWSDEFEKLYIHSYNGSCRLYSTFAYFCTELRIVASVEVGEKIISEMKDDLDLIFKK